MSEEEDYFLQNIKGVEPIKKKNKIRKHIKKAPKNIIEKNTLNTTKTVTKQTSKEKPIFALEFGQTNKKLKSGKISIDKKVDFHGKTLSEAEDLFMNVVFESYKKQKRCLLFITGKGMNKKNYLKSGIDESKPKLFYGKIRSAFLNWVKKPELTKFILTIEKANLENGGDGAFFVYLRKKTNPTKL